MERRIISSSAGLRRFCTALIAGLFVFGSAAQAAEGVLTKRRFNERTPAASLHGGRFTIAWTQAPVAHPRKLNVFVRRGQGKARRVNRRGTDGWAGGIAGDFVIYQEVNNGDSDIKLFNIRNGNRTSFRVNSRRWEFKPSKSGKWVLFGRSGRRDSVILLNAKTGRTRTLLRARHAFPGQVNGNYAVYSKCTSRSCDVFRYRISKRREIKIPHKRRAQYSPSVAANGTVYFAGSGLHCGQRVVIYRRRNGRTTRIARLGNKDTLSTYAAARAGGGTNVYYEQGRCGDDGGFARKGYFNVYRAKG